MRFVQVRRIKVAVWAGLLAFTVCVSFQNHSVENNDIKRILKERIKKLSLALGELKAGIQENAGEGGINNTELIGLVHASRLNLKRLDFWFRYADPIHYRWMNGPLPVEWETEVFEKYEAPYMRRAGGLMLIENELNEEKPRFDSLSAWCEMAIAGVSEIEKELMSVDFLKPEWFLFANRHFLLNLFSVYTTGYECPSEDRRIPELIDLCASQQEVNVFFSMNNSELAMDVYNGLFERMLKFLTGQSTVYSEFNHYQFIKDYVAPLYEINAGIIRSAKVRSRNMNDYSINNDALSLFDPGLFTAQNRKGIFSGVDDEKTLDSIRELGSKLFYDPILSGNMQRSCASCHKPEHLFADTLRFASTFDRSGNLTRNTPSLFLAASNHLLMHDGAHFSLQEQARQVIHHVKEMAGEEAAIMKRIGKVPEYQGRLNALAKATPLAPRASFEHALSAITYYYSSYGDSIPVFFSNLKQNIENDRQSVQGFNLFMGKAACATCHFLPRFNGVKPPFTGSEFEVIGTPSDKTAKRLSMDSGRYLKHPVPEMLHAFRTPGLWNVSRTFPYMHNGAFRTLEEVVDFYDAGGGIGKGLKINNQTLPADSLNLSPKEKNALLHFLQQLNTEEVLPMPPGQLPKSKKPELSAHRTGGKY
ncbi:MAG: cytochrome C peroxidase [Bacteroidetes bacterium]|nr:cytochrome C peroxidase [Bacteroidota bacterium]